MHLAVFWCCNYGALLIFHCFCLLPCIFVCFNYPTFHLYNQPCIVFIYTLCISHRWWKKSPYRSGRGSPPRSRTGCDIFSFCSHADCVSAGRPSSPSQFQSYAVIQTATNNRWWPLWALPISILCSHTDCVAVTVSGVDVTDVSILCSPYGLLWRPNGGKTMVLILCSHTQLTIYTGS